MVVLYYSSREHREDMRKVLKEQALGFARIGAIEYGNTVYGARSELLPFARVMERWESTSSSLNSCDELFVELLRSDRRYSFAGAVDADGNLICSSHAQEAPSGAPLESQAARRAIETGEFSIAETSVSPGARSVAIELALPFSRVEGLRGAIVASINPVALSEEVVDTSLPEGSIVTVLSRDGRIIARHPEPDRWVGEYLPPQSRLNVFGAMSGEARESVSIEGEPLLVASIGLRGSEELPNRSPLADAETILTVGIPRSVAYATADSQLRRNTLLLGAVAAVTVAAAWFGSGFFARQVRFYSNATRRFTEDISYRTGPPYPRSELGELGRAMDTMADAVATSQAEIQELNDSLEARIADRTAELVAANDELEAFSYSVLHDLRAPLRAISGFAQILVEDLGPTLEADAARQLGVIQQNAQQMGELVDDLLAFSRLNRQPMSPSLMEQWPTVQAVIEDAQASVQQSPEIIIGDLPPAQADPRLIRQVWVNLISNAIKFSAHAAHPRIEIGAQEGKDENIYFVRDNGVGFDMQYAGKLFGVFQRLHRAEEYEGTGVGLAIVQRIVNRHGGRVWAEAEAGHGATFYFSIPTGGKL